MKNLIVVFFCLFLSSCGNIYEDAYEAEVLYKAKKADPEAIHVSLTELESEFMTIYEKMTPSERNRYKAYRERENRKTRHEWETMMLVQSEALDLLNN